MHCDSVCQVSSDSIGLLGTQRFFITHQYSGILFREIRLLSKWSKNCGKYDYAWKVKQLGLSAVLVKHYVNNTAARDVMNIAARSSEFTLIRLCIFPQFLRNRIAPFKMLKFPSNCDYFWKWVGLNSPQILIPSDYDKNEKSKICRLNSYSNLKEFVLDLMLEAVDVCSRF